MRIDYSIMISLADRGTSTPKVPNCPNDIIVDTSG